MSWGRGAPPTPLDNPAQLVKNATRTGYDKYAVGGYFRCGYVKTEDTFTIGYIRDRILTVGGYLVTRIRSEWIRSEWIPSDRIRHVGAPPSTASVSDF